MKKEIILESLEVKLQELIDYHRSKMIHMSQQKIPDLTSEDLLNPDDYSEIVTDPDIMHQDGIVAGVLSAKILVRNVIQEMFEKDL